MRFDLHTHSTYSDGRNPLADNVRAAVACGLDVYAITDHWPSPGLSGGRFEAYLAEIAQHAAQLPIPILAGVEAPIMDLNGTVLLPERARERLDVVIAELHWGRGAGPELARLSGGRAINALREMYVAAAANPDVDIIAHPFNTGRSLDIGLQELPESVLREIAGAFVQGEKAFDLINSMWWWFPQVPVDRFTEQYARIVRIFAEEGVKFAPSSDAHACGAVGNLTWAMRVLKESSAERQILNPTILKGVSR